MEGSFDVVTLWCVVAHVADPIDLLVQSAELLRPGGTLLLTTPNFTFQNYYARALARLGRPLDFADQDHLLNFTPRALRLVLHSAGLVEPRMHYFGVTEECLLNRRLGPMLVPLKQAWNYLGVQAANRGLPHFGGELQVTARRPAGSGAQPGSSR